MYQQSDFIPPKSPSPNPSLLLSLSFSTHFLFPCWTDILYDGEDEIRGSWKAIVFLCHEEALWTFKRKKDRSNATVPCLLLFYSAVQLDSCGAQDSGHPEHQDRALCRHEQRGLPLHFGTVSTCNEVMPQWWWDYMTYYIYFVKLSCLETLFLSSQRMNSIYSGNSMCAKVALMCNRFSETGTQTKEWKISPPL